jgi:O-6-methylguanine DNA methyltransferase
MKLLEISRGAGLIGLPIQTSAGIFLAGYSEQGLAKLHFPSSRNRAPTDGTLSPEIRRWHGLAEQAVKQVLAGEKICDWPPLDLSAGTAFQQRVWSAMREIGPGQTRTYAELARNIGSPGAARAVGAACGANPIPLLVPCHRVIAARGKLGGFSGGLDWKRKLLAAEHFTFF